MKSINLSVWARTPHSAPRFTASLRGQCLNPGYVTVLGLVSPSSTAVLREEEC